MSGNGKPGCLAAIFGFFLFFYSIYTPVYFLILNDEIDSFQEATFIDMIVEPIKVAAGTGSQAEKFISGLENALSETRDKVEEKTGVDMESSLQSALEGNDDVSDINWSRGRAISEGLVEVAVTFKHKVHGNGAISAVIRERSFLNVTLSKFISISTVRVGLKRYSAGNIGVLMNIASLYGFDNDMLREFGEILEASDMY